MVATGRVERYTLPMTHTTHTDSKESKRGLGATLAPLRPMLPYAFRYKRQIFLALAALSAAALATLTLPVAVRGMIDHGFSQESAETVNSYFGALIAVVAILAFASGSRYYLVTSLGDGLLRICVAIFSATSQISTPLFMIGEDRRIIIAAHRRRDTDQIGVWGLGFRGAS